MKNKLKRAYYTLITSRHFLSFLKFFILLLLPLSYKFTLQLHMDFLISPNHLLTLGPGGEVCQFGSGSGSATRPLQIDLNLPPVLSWGEVFDELLAYHKKMYWLMRHLSESPVQPSMSMEGFDSRQEILEGVKEVLDGIDSQARELARDQERAPQLAEQMAPLAQTEAQPAQFDAQRRADEEAVTLFQRQLWAQKEFLKDAGEGSTSAPVDKTK